MTDCSKPKPIYLTAQAQFPHYFSQNPSVCLRQNQLHIKSGADTEPDNVYCHLI